MGLYISTRYQIASAYLAPHRLDLLIPAFAGLILCFFGGTFMTLIAVPK